MSQTDLPTPDDDRVNPIDLVLGQAERSECNELRDAVRHDPLAAIDLAETRDLVERFRTLRTEPSRRLRRGLDEVLRASERRLAARTVRRWWERTRT